MVPRDGIEPPTHTDFQSAALPDELPRRERKAQGLDSRNGRGIGLSGALVQNRTVD